LSDPWNDWRKEEVKLEEIDLEGVKKLRSGKMTTESVVMRASSGTIRWVKSEHGKQ
jgi:fructose-1,6-bisphosphatase/sedoheptulose 1,7-bisphosphatase-like protein